MAAASSAQPAGAGAYASAPQNAPDSAERAPLRQLPDLEPEEVRRRLAATLRELSNRRKIVVKNLPQDSSSQEVHDLLKAYELKYCYVDKSKGTAFVTLLNGEQAQDAIRTFHHSTIRGCEITVQLQPTDALLCVANLPHTFVGARFEELVRAYGNIERCFLVHSERTGHPKGYGFVEYMKKDSASRARAELLGRMLEDRALVVQWADVNHVTSEHLHSKCLCVDRLPADCDSEKLARVFGERHMPVFCQLAQDEGSPVGGFAVVEYETSEQAEDVLTEMDRRVIVGHEVRVSFCAPGTSGRSTLAALIAAQGVMSSNQRGLLPEPSLGQLLSSMRNPTALQVLLRPYLASGGKHTGKPGQMQSPPFPRHPLSAALLQLGKVQQNTLLGNSLMLQNLLQMQLAQQQLLQIKDNPVSTRAGLLGDPSRALLQRAMGLAATGKGLLGDAPNELSQDALHTSSTVAGPVSFPPSRPPQAGAACADRDGTPGIDKKPVTPGSPGSSQPGLRGLLNTRGGSGLVPASVPPGAPASGSESGTTGTMQASGQISLLGEPPKDVKLPSNPYLNLASVLPGIVLQAPANRNAASHSGAAATRATPLYSCEAPTDYMQLYGQHYSQEAMQWYQHYHSQGHGGVPQEGSYQREQGQDTAAVAYGDYGSYMQAVSQYYPHTPTAAQVFRHRDASKDADLSNGPMGSAPHSVTDGARATVTSYGPLTAVPGYVGLQQEASSPVALPLPTPVAADWSQFYYSQNQAHGLKRDCSQLQGASSDQSGLPADQSKKKRM